MLPTHFHVVSDNIITIYNLDKNNTRGHGKRITKQKSKPQITRKVSLSKT